MQSLPNYLGLLFNFYAYESQVWLQLKRNALAVLTAHSMQSLPNYFGLLFNFTSILALELTAKSTLVKKTELTKFKRRAAV